MSFLLLNSIHPSIFVPVCGCLWVQTCMCGFKCVCWVCVRVCVCAAGPAAAVTVLHLFFFHHTGGDGCQALHGPTLLQSGCPPPHTHTHMHMCSPNQQACKHTQTHSDTPHTQTHTTNKSALIISISFRHLTVVYERERKTHNAGIVCKTQTIM